jgi:hypothetical protein
VFTCGSTAILINLPPASPEKGLQIIMYTEVGKQLCQLVEKTSADISYLQKFASFFRGPDITVKYGPIIAWVEAGLEIGDLQELPIEGQ